MKQLTPKAPSAPTVPAGWHQQIEDAVQQKQAAMAANSLPSLYVSAKQLEELTGIRYSTWNTWRFQGRGPRWISVSRRRVLYDLADVKAWLNARTVQSTAEADLLPVQGA